MPTPKRFLFWTLLIVSTFAFLEIALRGLTYTALCFAVDNPARTSCSPSATTSASKWRRDPDMGYENLPGARVRPFGEPLHEETLNQEGFRGQDLAVKKNADTFRVALIGDSVVEALEVAWPHTWAEKMRERLQAHTHVLGANIARVEVINAGVGGYTAWQTRQRFTKRVAKYRPDLVLVLVGWNDLLWSHLKNWTPKMHLAELELAVGGAAPETGDGFDVRIFSALKETTPYSYIGRLAWNAYRMGRNRLWQRAVIAKQRDESETPFNKAGLENYLKEMSQLKQSLLKQQIPFKVIIWPSLAHEAVVGNPAIERVQISIYRNWNFSGKTWLGYIRRYQTALRNWCVENAVSYVDVNGEMAAVTDPQERLNLMSDHAHLTVAGNALMAEVIARNLTTEKKEIDATVE